MSLSGKHEIWYYVSLSQAGFLNVRQVRVDYGQSNKALYINLTLTSDGIL